MEPDQSAVVKAAIVKLDGEAPARAAEDALAVEEPLELRLSGKAATVIMRTPGHDVELARGFLYTEGLITTAADLVAARRPDGLKPDEVGNVLDLEVAPALVRIQHTLQRNFYASSSCGVCGKSSLQAIAVKSPKVVSDLAVSRAVVRALPDRLRAAQATFAVTGGLHAAGLFTADGALLAVREDVGRHNAVDKVIGWALAEGRVPATRCVLMVSGRTSFEILQKAIAAGIPVVCAVSAPSSLAVTLAERFDVTLVGFLRGGSMNLYSHPSRITG